MSVSRRRLCTLPNLLTLLRIMLGPFVLLALAHTRSGEALVLFALAGLTDLGDGWLARHFNQKSLWGQILDPVADKFLMACVWTGLCVGYGFSPLVAFVLAGRDLLVIAGSWILRHHPGFVVQPLQAGKINTFVQVMFVLLFLGEKTGFLPLSPALHTTGMASLLLTALWSGVVYGRFWWRLRSSGDPAP